MTKADLAAHYERVADVMLPHLTDARWCCTGSRTASGVRAEVVRRDLPGEPAQVCVGSAEAALTMLAERLEAALADPRATADPGRRRPARAHPQPRRRFRWNLRSRAP